MWRFESSIPSQSERTRRVRVFSWVWKMTTGWRVRSSTEVRRDRRERSRTAPGSGAGPEGVRPWKGRIILHPQPIRKNPPSAGFFVDWKKPARRGGFVAAMKRLAHCICQRAHRSAGLVGLRGRIPYFRLPKLANWFWCG
jgi:hypothetical protein